MIRRLAVYLYDALILLSLYSMCTIFCIFFQNGNVIPAGSVWYQSLLMGITYCYYAISYKFGGQTIGMRAWHIKLIFEKGPTQGQILLRFLLIPPAFILGLCTFKTLNIYLLQWTKSQRIKL